MFRLAWKAGKASAVHEPFDVTRALLVAYHILSVVGWGYVLVLTLIHIFNLDGNSDTFKVEFNKLPTVVSSNNAIVRIGLRLFSSLYSQFPIPAFIPNPFKLGISNVRKTDPPSFFRSVYQLTSTTFLRIGPTVVIVQSFAAFEIIYVLVQQTRVPIQTTAWFITPRLVVLCGILGHFPEAQSKPIYTAMVLVWSITDIACYLFHSFAFLDECPLPPIASFIDVASRIFQPIGTGLEAILIFTTLPLFWDTWKFTDYLRCILSFIWWPGIRYIYNHIMWQRDKNLEDLVLKKN